MIFALCLGLARGVSCWGLLAAEEEEGEAVPLMCFPVLVGGNAGMAAP